MPPPNSLRMRRARAMKSRDPAQGRADRGAEALAEADGHAVERLRPGARRRPGGDDGVPQAGRRRGASVRPLAWVQALIAWIFSSG